MNAKERQDVKPRVLMFNVCESLCIDIHETQRLTTRAVCDEIT
jgi:hypothetical protein